MTDWLEWFGNIVWQPSKDERLTTVEAEVESLTKDMAGLKERTRALEEARDAFQRIGRGGRA